MSRRPGGARRPRAPGRPDLRHWLGPLAAFYFHLCLSLAALTLAACAGAVANRPTVPAAGTSSFAATRPPPTATSTKTAPVAPSATGALPALPTPGPTVTAKDGAEATHTPGTPCTDAACAQAHSHLWLGRPIPAEAGLVTYPDRSYPYGSTQGGLREPHHGVEFANRNGTPVIAVAEGTVVVAGDDSSAAYGPTTRFYGNLVVIELARRYQGEPVFALYGHLSAVSVRVGDAVAPGDVLGLVGGTGVAIGPHLHFEVRVGSNNYGHTRNPELWLEPLPNNGQPLGVIAGRVVDTQGQPVPEVTVVIRPVSTNSDEPRHRYVTTYAGFDPAINADEWLNENFAITDVPRGLYTVSVNTTRTYQHDLTVRAGEVAWVEFVVEAPPPTAPPGTATAWAATEIALTGTPAEAGTPDPNATPTETSTPAPDQAPTATAAAPAETITPGVPAPTDTPQP